jgi:hypothetical protein
MAHASDMSRLETTGNVYILTNIESSLACLLSHGVVFYDRHREGAPIPSPN